MIRLAWAKLSLWLVERRVRRIADRADRYRSGGRTEQMMAALTSLADWSLKLCDLRREIRRLDRRVAGARMTL